MPEYRSASGSAAEDLFIDLFADTFGAEKAGYLYSQYPFRDIYQNARFADFVLENGATRVAIEIDDSNRKQLFMEMVEQMDMSYSYKPVLLKAILTYADAAGRVNSYQQEILDKLEAERTVRGFTRNLIVAATGTGKIALHKVVIDV